MSYLLLASCCVSALMLLLALPVRGQVVVTQVNDEGVAAPCIGIGIGLLLEHRCIDAVGKQGFVRKNEIGDPGFVLGTGDKDGILTEVEPDSPAAKAGFQPGDEIATVDGKPLKASTTRNATIALFAKPGDHRGLTVQQTGTEKTADLILGPPK